LLCDTYMKYSIAVLLVGILVIIGIYASQSLDRSGDVSTISRVQEQSRVEEQPKIFALWDSLTAWYQLPLEESYPAQLEELLQQNWYAYTVLNAWKSGDTSAGLLARVEWLTEEAAPNDIAILVIGANDGMQSLSLATLEENIQEIISILQDAWLQVVVGGMQIPTNLEPRYREDFTSIYPRLVEANNLSYIPFFLENVATIPELNLSDGIHPNATGYAIIAQQVFMHLKENNLISDTF